MSNSSKSQIYKSQRGVKRGKNKEKNELLEWAKAIEIAILFCMWCSIFPVYTYCSRRCFYDAHI